MPRRAARVGIAIPTDDTPWSREKLTLGGPAPWHAAAVDGELQGNTGSLICLPPLTSHRRLLNSQRAPNLVHVPRNERHDGRPGAWDPRSCIRPELQAPTNEMANRRRSWPALQRCSIAGFRGSSASGLGAIRHGTAPVLLAAAHSPARTYAGCESRYSGVCRARVAVTSHCSGPRLSHLGDVATGPAICTQPFVLTRANSYPFLWATSNWPFSPRVYGPDLFTSEALHAASLANPAASVQLSKGHERAGNRQQLSLNRQCHLPE